MYSSCIYMLTCNHVASPNPETSFRSCRLCASCPPFYPLLVWEYEVAALEIRHHEGVSKLCCGMAFALLPSCPLASLPQQHPVTCMRTVICLLTRGIAVGALQDAQNEAIWDAVFFMNATQLHANLVHHAVLLLFGNEASIDVAAGRAATNMSGEGGEPLPQNTLSAWVEHSSVTNNLLLSSKATEDITRALTAAALTSPGGTAAEYVQQFILSSGTPRQWTINGIHSNNMTKISNPLVVALQEGNVAPTVINQLIPLPLDTVASPKEMLCNQTLDDPRAASVYWASAALLVARNVTIAANKGFPSAIWHEAGWLVHMQNLSIYDNVVGQSLVTLMQADAVLKGWVVDNNTASASKLVSVKNTRLAFMEVSSLQLSIHASRQLQQEHVRGSMLWFFPG